MKKKGPSLIFVIFFYHSYHPHTLYNYFVRKTVFIKKKNYYFNLFFKNIFCSHYVGVKSLQTLKYLNIFQCSVIKMWRMEDEIKFILRFT